MPRILIADGMDKKAVEQLRELGYDVVEEHYEGDALEDALRKFDCIILRSATKLREPLIQKVAEAGQLKLIIRGGVGLDNIDVAYAESVGIKVKNTPKASSASVAELAIAHMFTLARHLHESNVTMRQGQWLKKQYKGIELSGKKLGLIGFGRIARETAKRAYALGMDVYYTNRSGAKEGFDEYTYLPFQDLLETVDFISLHIPYNKEHGAVLSDQEFAQMKKGMYLINTARGGVVDEAALLRSIESGIVAAAAFDVFSEEPTGNVDLYSHPNVSVSPHIGGSTKEAQKRIGLEILEIVKNNL